MKRRIAPRLFALCVILGSPCFASSADRVKAMFHDIHISFGRAELSPKNFSAKLTLYKDDFLRALNTWHTGGYAGMNATDFRALELRYMTGYFRVWAGSSQLTLSTYKRTEEEASVTFELDYSLETLPPILTLDDRILFREYNDQTNVLVVKGYGQEINHVFTKGSPSFYFHP
jgi:hypothetical protein